MISRDAHPIVVPINIVPLPEAHSNAGLETSLKSVYEEGLPGFVIRVTSDTETEVSSHHQIAHDAGSLLTQANYLRQPTPYIYKSHDMYSATFRSEMVGAGQLHHDFVRFTGLDVRVHRTHQGAGKVSFANAGSQGLEMYERGLKGRLAIHSDVASLLLQSGFVNPNYIHPTIHEADLNPGDTVVFPTVIHPSDTHDKAGPVWHRFDTSIAPRVANILTVTQ